MQKYLFLMALLVSSYSSAVSWKVYGPCSEQPVYSGAEAVDLSQSVGKISQNIFDLHKVPYVGTDAGFNSIINTPTGLDAMEVLSDTEMRAYGWCFTVNGKLPKEMPDQIKLDSQSAEIVWFYGYSTLIKNDWTDYCVPGYKIKAKQFCH